MAQIDLKNAVITLSDGTSPAQTLTVTLGEGNLTWSERRNIDYTLDGGNLDEVREGDQVPVEMSLSATWTYITGSLVSAAGSTGTDDSVPSFSDAIKGEGICATGAAGSGGSGTGGSGGGEDPWVSSDADLCRPYAVDVIVTYTPSCSSTYQDTETITFADFRWEQLDSDLRAGTIACSGKCNIIAPTVVRS